MSDGAPTVSLLMAAYSPQPDWLRQAVSSGLEQEGCSLELIVVDDGSPTPVSELLSGLEDDDRLRLLRIEHGGASKARNAGTSAARGDYIRFLDADDVYPPDSTAALLDLIDCSDQTIACGATRWCDEELRALFDWIAGIGDDPIRDYLLLRSTPMLPSMLFPRPVVDATGSWEESLRVSEDWDFILRALEHARIVETPRAVTLYRQRPGSLSSNRYEAWRGTLLGVERYFERHPDQRTGPLGRKVRAMLDLLAAELSSPGSPWRDRRSWRALARDPSSLRTIHARWLHPRVQAARMQLTTAPLPPFR